MGATGQAVTVQSRFETTGATTRLGNDALRVEGGNVGAGGPSDFALDVGKFTIRSANNHLFIREDTSNNGWIIGGDQSDGSLKVSRRSGGTSSLSYVFKADGSMTTLGDLTVGGTLRANVDSTASCTGSQICSGKTSLPVALSGCVNGGSTAVTIWQRVGNVVTGSFTLDWSPNAATSCLGLMTLPISSAFTSYTDATGNCIISFGDQPTGDTVQIRADAASHKMRLRYQAPNVGSRTLECTFSYVVA